MSFLITLGVWAMTWAISYALREPVEEEDPLVELPKIPRADVGENVPFVFGRQRIDAPTVIWSGRYDYRDLVVGSGPDAENNPLEFYGNFQLALAVSNVNITEGTDDAMARICDYGIYVDEKQPALGDWAEVVPAGTQQVGVTMHRCDVSIGAGNQIQGMGGIVEFNPGLWDTDHGYLTNIVLSNASVDMAYVPPYAGTVTAMFGSLITTGGVNYRWWMGNRSSPPRLGVEFINPCAVPGIGQGILEMTGGDANPVAVLYTVLTHPWWGLKLDPNDFDLDSLYDAAVQLFIEQNGMSGTIYKGESADTLVSKICEQCEGSVYTHPETHKVTFTLVREASYDPDDLEIVSAANGMIINAEFSPASREDVRNFVGVRFYNRDKSFEQDLVEVQNQADYEATGRRKEVVYDLPFVTNRTNAIKCATRILRSQGTPLVKVRFEARRSTVFWHSTKVFKYQHTNGRIYIMRVLRADVGATSEAVLIDAAQDRWDYSHVTVIPPDVVQPTPPAPPLGPIDESVLETPRYLLAKAVEAGAALSLGNARLMYLAAPSDSSAGYRGKLDDGVVEAFDTAITAFAGTARLAVDYSRESEPFDDSEGLTIDTVQDWDVVGEPADEAQVRTLGWNLIQVGDGPDAEIMAYLGAVDEGGGGYTLVDVERGLLDTVPRLHIAGEPVFRLELRSLQASGSVVSKLGRRAILPSTEVDGRIFVARGGELPPDEDVDSHELTVISRPMLPYPVADMTVAPWLVVASKEFALPVEEDGVDVFWKRRDRLKTFITLGDDADEPATEPTTYSVYVRRAPDAEIEVEPDIDDVEVFDVAAAKAGHGAIDVYVRSRRVDTIGGGVTVTYESWQDPAIRGEFLPWRNLLLNHAFSVDNVSSLARWSTISGTPVVGGTGPYLALGYVIGTTDDDPTEWYQRVNVKGYRPKRMRAMLRFKSKLISDGGSPDTVEADIQSLDDVGATQQTTTLATTSAGSTWTQRTLEIANLDDDTESLQARIEQRDVGEAPFVPQGAVSDFELRLGQFTDELFDASLNATTGWTVTAGSFTTGSSNPALGSAYVQGGTNATNTLQRSGSVPAGMCHGHAMFQVGTRYLGPGTFTGTISVTIEAMLGGTPLTSMTRNGLGLDSGWWRTRVYCEVPRTATSIRVTLSSTTLSGTANQVQWNDGSIRIYKHLSPTHETTFDFSDPPSQDLPRSTYRWAMEHEDIPVPTYGFWSGTTIGQLGLEPEMRHMAGVYASKVFLPEAHDAFEFREGSEAVVHARNDATFGNFSSSQSFTARIVFCAHTDLTSYGLLGRLGATGWELDVNAGNLRARLVGSLLTKTTTIGAPARGGLTWASISYDAVAGTLRVAGPGGTSTVSTAGMGEISCTELIPFCIGDHTNVDAVPMTGVVASVELWDSVISHSALGDVWVRDDAYWAPTVSVVTPPIGGAPVSCVIGTDENGIIRGEWAQGSSGVWALLNGEKGMPLSKPRTNLIDPDPNKTTGWSSFGEPTVTLDYGWAPSGRKQSVLIVGNGDNGRKKSVPTLDPDKLVNISFDARAAVPGTALLWILDNANSLCIEDFLTFEVTTSWERIDIYAKELLPGSAGTFVVWMPGEDVLQLEIAGPIWIDQTDPSTEDHAPPVAIPTTTNGDSTSYIQVEALDLDLKYLDEGEIEARLTCLSPTTEGGTIASMAAGSDAQRLYVEVTGGIVKFDHADSVGSTVTSEVTNATAWNVQRVLRGRWNRASTLDQANAYAGLVTEDGQDFDRTAIWTAGSTPIDAIDIGNDGGSDVKSGLMVKLVVRSRETILPETIP